MKTLNLVNLEKSDIKYKISKFPDGQQNISIDFNIFEDIRANNKIQGYSHQVEIHRNYEVLIKSRLNNWLDLELITCAVACLKECQVFNIHLYVPYIMGARSDRKFEEGGNNYVKHVIAPAINNLKLKSVTCIDPHSDVAENCINNFIKKDNQKLVEFMLWNLYDQKSTSPKQTIREVLDVILISPDAGASKKIYKLAEQIGYKGDIITCSKDRDKDGKLTQCVVPIKEEHLKKDIIIIDDIFDFGGTFKNIAGILNDAGHLGKKYLIVTHSIQTEGLKDALKWFDIIYTTNSYKDHNLEKIKQLNVF